MICISTFNHLMDHEFPDHQHLVSNRYGFKVDGEKGIRNCCGLQKLKSVDYFENHSIKGFLLVEFSDLVKQDIQIKALINNISDSNLAKAAKAQLRKEKHKVIHQELVSKFKDSCLVLHAMPNNIANIPDCFEAVPIYAIVVAPILDNENRYEKAMFLDVLKNKLTQSLPEGFFQKVKIVTADEFFK